MSLLQDDGAIFISQGDEARLVQLASRPMDEAEKTAKALLRAGPLRVETGPVIGPCP
jgi:hypothetical protein